MTDTKTTVAISSQAYDQLSALKTSEKYRSNKFPEIVEIAIAKLFELEKDEIIRSVEKLSRNIT